MKAHHAHDAIHEKIDLALRKKEFGESLRNRSFEEIIGLIDMYRQQLCYQDEKLARTNSQMERLKRRYEQLFQAAPIGYVIYDETGRIREANDTFCSLLGLSAQDVNGQNIFHFVAPGYQDSLCLVNGNVARKGEADSVELKFQGREKQVDATVMCNTFAAEASVTESEETPRPDEHLIRCAVMDTTHLNQVLYASYHDPMTGLLNRRYYDEKTAVFAGPASDPLSVAVVDVDGLKLVNDTLGHDYGDQVIMSVTGVLREQALAHYTLIRIGGDEIAVIFPRTTPDEAEQYLDDCVRRIEKIQIGGINVSISCGVVGRRHAEYDIPLLVSQAEDIMYSGKMLRSVTRKKSIIALVQKQLFSHCPALRQHCKAVTHTSLLLAELAGLPQEDVHMLRQAGELHDVGLVAFLHRRAWTVDDARMFESAEFMRHAQIGCRILHSMPGMEQLGDIVLFHHECWDGSGYPYGLKGSQIPLLSRIIAIADAYAWLNEGASPLKIAPNAQRAFFEQQCGGKFDPDLGHLFLEQCFHS